MFTSSQYADVCFCRQLSWNKTDKTTIRRICAMVLFLVLCICFCLRSYVDASAHTHTALQPHNVCAKYWIKDRIWESVARASQWIVFRKQIACWLPQMANWLNDFRVENYHLVFLFISMKILLKHNLWYAHNKNKSPSEQFQKKRYHNCRALILMFYKRIVLHEFCEMLWNAVNIQLN